MSLQATQTDRAIRDARRGLVSPVGMKACVRLCDVAITVICGIAVYLTIIALRQQGIDDKYFPTIIIASILAGVVFNWAGAYKDEYLFSGRPHIQRILLGWAIAFAILLTLAFSFKVSQAYSRLWAGFWFVSAAVALTGSRLTLNSWLRQQVDEGRFGLRTVILGAGLQGERLVEQIERASDFRTKLIGFIDDRKTRVPKTLHGYEILGDTNYLIDLIRRNAVDQVFVALPWSASHRLREVIHQIGLTPIPVRLAPDLIGFEYANLGYSQVAELPMLHIFDRPISGWSYIYKTLEDRVLGGLMLLFVLPFMLLMGLAIKLDSAGPVFFRQKRQGFNNTTFMVWKFRTMYVQDTDAGGAVQATRNDPRVTRMGRFLRRSSLDELPQLINVMEGTMSLVGPRPHPIMLKAGGQPFSEVVDRYAARHRVKPGITGWAQVNGLRGETDTVDKIQRRVEYDLYYIDNWTVWLDFKILLKTIVTVLMDENAY